MTWVNVLTHSQLVEQPCQGHWGNVINKYIGFYKGLDERVYMEGHWREYKL